MTKALSRGVIVAAVVAVGAAAARRRMKVGTVGAGHVAETAHGRLAEYTVTVLAPPQEVYAAWRRLERLPGTMRHLEEVEVIDETHSRWTTAAPAPGLGPQEWIAEIDDDRPGERIAWHATSSRFGTHQGEVTFAAAPGGRGTELHARLRYEPPFGIVGEAVARLAGESPQQQLREDLRRFKATMESGEAIEVTGQPSGRGSVARQTQEFLAKHARAGGRV